MLKREVNNISGVVLSGGENKRFGGVIKSNIIVGSSTIIRRILNTITDIFHEIIIVTNSPGEFKFEIGCKIVQDQFHQIGPLGGIHSALKASDTEAVFVFAGDMPFLDKELIMNQIKFYTLSTAEVVIPKVDGYIEPLHGIYSKSIYQELDKYLSGNSNYSIRDFLDNVQVEFMDLPSDEKTKRGFTNINTPSSAEDANRLAQSEEM